MSVNPIRSFAAFFLFAIVLNGFVFAQLRQFNIDTDLIKAKKFRVLDFDGDLDMDVVAAASDTTVSPVYVVWYEQEANGTFTRHDVSTTDVWARDVDVANLTGDSRPEIVVGSVFNPAGNISYHTANTNPPADSWTRNTFDSDTDSAYAVVVVDFDQDNDIDVVSCNFGAGSDGSVFWFENLGGGSFTRRDIDTGLQGPDDVVVGDLDNDGDLDVFSNEYLNASIYYYINDGSQNFTRVRLNNGFAGPNEMDLGDFNNDGLLDLVATAYLGDRISWWRNTTTGGVISWSSQIVILNNVDEARSVDVVDVNADGIDDIVAAGEEQDRVEVLFNDGVGNFSLTTISNSHDLAYYATGGDMDGDGDIDVIATAENLNTISWWETEDQDDQEIAAGDVAPAPFWGGDVVIDFSAGTNDTVTVFFNAGAVPDTSDLDAAIDHLAPRGWYTITTQKTGYAASVDFYYGSDKVGLWGSGVTDENDLVICVYNSSTNQWEVAGSSQVINAGADFITVNGISNEFDRYSRWTIGSTTPDNPLPIQLASFQAVSVASGINVRWSTSAEINNQGFEIWRSEDPEDNFFQLASYQNVPALVGAGNANELTRYNFIDRNVVENRTYYYKLMSVDVDGTRHEYNSVSTAFTGGPAIEVLTFELAQNYPNPFNGVTNIPFVLERGDLSGDLAIFDVLGRKVRTFNFQALSAGLHTITWNALDDNGLAVGSGQYIYVLTVGNQRLSQRLMYVK